MCYTSPDWVFTIEALPKDMHFCFRRLDRVNRLFVRVAGSGAAAGQPGAKRIAHDNSPGLRS